MRTLRYQARLAWRMITHNRRSSVLAVILIMLPMLLAMSFISLIAAPYEGVRVAAQALTSARIDQSPCIQDSELLDDHRNGTDLSAIGNHHQGFGRFSSIADWTALPPCPAPQDTPTGTQLVAKLNTLIPDATFGPSLHSSLQLRRLPAPFNDNGSLPAAAQDFADHAVDTHYPRLGSMETTLVDAKQFALLTQQLPAAAGEHPLLLLPAHVAPAFDLTPGEQLLVVPTELPHEAFSWENPGIFFDDNSLEIDGAPTAESDNPPNTDADSIDQHAAAPTLPAALAAAGITPELDAPFIAQVSVSDSVNSPMLSLSALPRMSALADALLSMPVGVSELYGESSFVSATSNPAVVDVAADEPLLPGFSVRITPSTQLAAGVIQPLPLLSREAMELRSLSLSTLLGMLLLLLFVAAVIMPVFAIRARRQVKQFAILRSQGATSRDVLLLSLLQTVQLTVLALLTTALLLIPVTWSLFHLFQLTQVYTLPIYPLLFLAGGGVFAALLAGIIPAWWASNLPPAVALHGGRPTAMNKLHIHNWIGPLLIVGSLGVFAISKLIQPATVLKENPQSWDAEDSLIVLLVALIGLLLSGRILVYVVSRISSRLPVLTRIAARDLWRSVHRTGPAVAAVAAITVFVFGGLAMSASTFGGRESDRLFERTNLVVSPALYPAAPASIDPFTDTIDTIADALNHPPSVTQYLADYPTGAAVVPLLAQNTVAPGDSQWTGIGDEQYSGDTANDSSLVAEQIHGFPYSLSLHSLRIVDDGAAEDAPGDALLTQLHNGYDARIAAAVASGKVAADYRFVHDGMIKLAVLAPTLAADPQWIDEDSQGLVGEDGFFHLTPQLPVTTYLTLPAVPVDPALLHYEIGVAQRSLVEAAGIHTSMERVVFLPDHEVNPVALGKLKEIAESASPSLSIWQAGASIYEEIITVLVIALAWLLALGVIAVVIGLAAAEHRRNRTILAALGLSRRELAHFSGIQGLLIAFTGMIGAIVTLGAYALVANAMQALPHSLGAAAFTQAHLLAYFLLVAVVGFVVLPVGSYLVGRIFGGRGVDLQMLKRIE
ncbi:FtsX-like permease family protein [Corynebacterium choanae]|uniref:FtsX-like permease family protein n=1 Tax=Corynebacterium choanae TaxID=1862358 RepID=A0A3G6J9T2_9CORY|nr:FtsX-like permease family protein [Corynebacterium choanae]AZA14659.1 FtsX-like permease family protein [Corynebacterium choanae]